MFKKSIGATILALSALLSSAAIASNSQYGVISEIRYNTPTDVNNASIILVLENDNTGFYNSNEYLGCYSNGVENWYVNLASHPIVVEKLIARLELAKANGTVVRLFGADDACSTGTPNDIIHEAYFYNE